MGRRILILLFAAAFFMADMAAQGGKPPTSGKGLEMYEDFGWIIEENGDTLYTATLPPLPFFAKKKDFRKYQKMVRNVKKVYPYAKEAGEYMRYLEEEIPKLKTDKQKKNFTKKVEKDIVDRYTPLVENMTRSEGNVLIKLIYRETQMSAYEILKDFRGNFSAGFWNTIARLFKANLKQTYDPLGEDEIMEQIVRYVEAGLL